MTRTEDRLADALDAVARSVKQETLPPLPARGPSLARQRWGRWLAPLAAAASVALIVVLVSVIHPFSAGTPRGGGQIGGPPRYYATVEHGGIYIRKTATGAVTATIPNKTPGPGSFPRYAMTVAAASDGREFVAGYSWTSRSTYRERSQLYSFHLTSAGHVAGFSPVKGGPITGLLLGRGIAVSPDGSKVALALYPALDPAKPPSPAKIVVINLKTGVRGLWQGGLERSGLSLNIPNISWQPGGNGLVFLALWCRSEVVDSGFCQPGPHYAQVRTLSLGAGGGPLSQGTAVLSQSARYPDITQALLSPDAKTITMVLLRGPYAGKAIPVPQRFQVIRVPAGGGPSRLLYHGATGGHIDVILGSDASGEHLLLAWRSNGWIDHGVLRPLPPQGGAAITDAW